MFHKMSVFLILVTILNFLKYTKQDKQSELVLVHALFRHGDRTPIETTYPTDPYEKFDYYPFGIGQLTDTGKRREYELGKILRKRYGNFLGKLYLPELLSARSTVVPRARMSLLLVLASLFPPYGREQWNKNLNWQPIPYDYVDLSEDKILFGAFACSKSAQYLEEVANSSTVAKIHEKYDPVYNYIANHTKITPLNLMSSLIIQSTLKAQKEWGFELPEWTDEVFPEPLNILAGLAFSLTGAPKLKNILAGALLQKVINDTQSKINGEIKTKLFLYSAHDLNVASLLTALDVFKPHSIPYGACVLLEVHKIDGQYGIKIYYENYKNIQSGYLTMPGCEEFCSFDKFVCLVTPFFPSKELCGEGTPDFEDTGLFPMYYHILPNNQKKN